jgi:hypothetical protein
MDPPFLSMIADSAGIPVSGVRGSGADRGTGRPASRLYRSATWWSAESKLEDGRVAIVGKAVLYPGGRIENVTAMTGKPLARAVRLQPLFTLLAGRAVGDLAHFAYGERGKDDDVRCGGSLSVPPRRLTRF